MANPVAGRILLLPKGDWDPNETYSILDMVNHNNTTYIGKKTSTNVEPGTDPDYWFAYYIRKKFDADEKDVIDAFNYVFFGIIPEPEYDEFVSLGSPNEVQDAYDSVFGGISLSSNEILNALNTPWDGSSSPDPTAMQSGDVSNSINTPWDGSSSPDPTAMQSGDVSNAIQ